MQYTPNPREVDAKIDNQYAKAHTDFGMRFYFLHISQKLIYIFYSIGLLTILFPQIVNGFVTLMSPLRLMLTETLLIDCKYERPLGSTNTCSTSPDMLS